MANESRKSRALRQQNPGMASTGRVDPAAGARARRAAAGEQAAGLRYRQGLRVQDDGSLEVHTDATLRVDQRQQLGVRNKFDTPTKDTQAANKAYVDDAIASIVTGSAWQSVTMLPEERTNLGGSDYVVVGQTSSVHYFGALTDLDNLAGVGPNGLQLATGYYWVLRQQVLVGNQSGSTRTVQVRLVQDQGGSIVTLTSFETAIGNGLLRTINLETISSGGDDVYLEVGTTSVTNIGIVIDSARLHAQLLELRNDPDITGSLPPPLGITASFSAESLTAIAWTDDVAFLQTSLGDADTFTWTFDEWGPTYLDYSGAYGSLVSHRFMDGGTHTVELTASGPSGSDTATVDVVVQDVFETQNLLRTVSVEDFSDFTTNGTVSTSSIAAPDGTLTAQDIAYTVTGATYIQKTAADYGSVWKLGAGWSSSFYFYQPTLPGNVQFDTYIYNSGGTQINNFRTTINPDGSLRSFGGTAVYGPAFTSERNLDLRKIGDTGWYQVTVFIGDYGVAADKFLFIRLVNQTAGGTYTYWNPTLRYGDWVARGKNWHPLPNIGDWYIDPVSTLERSALPAPDGTLSAWQQQRDDTSNSALYTQNQPIPTTGGTWTWEIWVNHSNAKWTTQGNLYMYMNAGSVGTERVRVGLNQAGGANGISVYATSGPGYTLADNVDQQQIGAEGWWRYRITLTDYSATSTTVANYVYVQDAASAPARITLWGNRLTVGNPADARGYFVSGPQNLLGDGSDYSGWTAGAN